MTEAEAVSRIKEVGLKIVGRVDPKLDSRGFLVRAPAHDRRVVELYVDGWNSRPSGQHYTRLYPPVDPIPAPAFAAFTVLTAPIVSTGEADILSEAHIRVVSRLR